MQLMQVVILLTFTFVLYFFGSKSIYRFLSFYRISYVAGYGPRVERSFDPFCLLFLCYLYILINLSMLCLRVAYAYIYIYIYDSGF